MFSAALAFRVLASLVPLTLLAVALLGVFGLEDVWREWLGPAVQEKVTAPVYRGIDYTVERLFSEDAATVIVLGSLLALWHVSRGVRIVMKALNAIHDEREQRSPVRLWLTDVALATALILLLGAAFVLATGAPRLADGVLGALLQVAGWGGAAVLVAVAVGLLVRYAPAERPEVGWATAGSAFIVVTWLAASAVFGSWVRYVADYKSAAGTLLAFLVLTTYLLTSTTIFLAGAQLDELARKGGR